MRHVEAKRPLELINLRNRLGLITQTVPMEMPRVACWCFIHMYGPPLLVIVSKFLDIIIIIIRINF